MEANFFNKFLQGISSAQHDIWLVQLKTVVILKGNTSGNRKNAQSRESAYPQHAEAVARLDQGPPGHAPGCQATSWMLVPSILFKIHFGVI